MSDFCGNKRCLSESNSSKNRSHLNSCKYANMHFKIKIFGKIMLEFTTKKISPVFGSEIALAGRQHLFTVRERNKIGERA